MLIQIVPWSLLFHSKRVLHKTDSLHSAVKLINKYHQSIFFSMNTYCFTDQDVPVLIPALSWNLFLIENYCTNWMFLWIILCSHSVLCCLRRRPCTLLNTRQGGPSTTYVVLYRAHRNIFNYRELACTSKSAG